MSTILTFDLMRDANGLQRQIYTTKYCSISLSSFVFFSRFIFLLFSTKKNNHLHRLQWNRMCILEIYIHKCVWNFYIYI